MAGETRPPHRRGGDLVPSELQTSASPLASRQIDTVTGSNQDHRSYIDAVG
jgi:hypothetical protein